MVIWYQFINTVIFDSQCLLHTATEYHDLLLYYMLPLVRPYLPSDYFSHFALLVTAITILLSDASLHDVQLAGILLKYFVQEMEPLYGQTVVTVQSLHVYYISGVFIGCNAMTINVHSLCHLSQQVLDHGPLWTNSMFSFENTVKEI